MTQPELFQTTIDNDKLAIEKSLRLAGYTSIAGVDEVGRGPLAGPVMAAAVILPAGVYIDGVDDSKKLSAKKREQLFDRIMSIACAVAIGAVEPAEIDRINILQATRKAMLKAVMQLSPVPDYLLIDGTTPIASAVPQKTVIKGDSLSLSIAAASIIAKVTRDRLLHAMDQIYPGYGFASHKGYGSSLHMDAIRRLGPCPIHRLSFGGVKEYVPDTPA